MHYYLPFVCVPFMAEEKIKSAAGCNMCMLMFEYTLRHSDASSRC